MTRPALRNNIRRRLTRALLGLAVLPLLLVGAFVSFVNWQAQAQTAQTVQSQAARQVAGQVAAFIRAIENEAHLTLHLHDHFSLTYEQQKTTLGKLLAYDNAIDEMALLDITGHETVRLSRVVALSAADLRDRRTAPEFSHPLRTGQTYYSPVWLSPDTNEPLMLMSVPMVNIRTNRFEGVLVLSVRMKSMWELVAQRSTELGQDLYIVDNTGWVVAHPNPSVVLRHSTIPMPPATGFAPGLDNPQAVLAYDPLILADQKLYILAERSVWEALRPAIVSLSTTFAALFVMLLTTSGMGWLLARQITRPIQELAQTVQALEAGDWARRAHVQTDDELETLALGFNAMAARLQTTIAELEQHVGQLQQMQHALQASEQRYRSIFENAQEGIFQSTLTGQFQIVNPALVRMLGYDTLEEVLQLHLAEDVYFTPAAQTGLAAQLNLTGDLTDYEVTLKKKDGTPIIVSLYSHALVDSAGAVIGYEGLVLNITERKRAEHDLRQLNADLERRVQERTAQMEAANRELEAFSYSVSHDLRAPVRAMHGFARIVSEEYAPSLEPQAQEYLRLVLENAHRMGELIDDLLEFARLSRQPLHKQPVDMNIVVRRARENLPPEPATRVIEWQLDDLPPCEGDASLLRQIYINFFVNALKFTRSRPIARLHVGAEVLDTGETVYFVKDNGIGFDMRYAHKLFGVFQQLHPPAEYGGTGVGLALVKRIVQRHGGRIWVNAQIEAGATFYFTI